MICALTHEIVVETVDRLDDSERQQSAAANVTP
jgi:hypothetical protein